MTKTEMVKRNFMRARTLRAGEDEKEAMVLVAKLLPVDRLARVKAVRDSLRINGKLDVREINRLKRAGR